jgi:2-oxoglutarate dehydrogenase E1 component
VASEQRVVMEKTQKNFDVLKLIEGYRSRTFVYKNKSGARQKLSPTLDIENFGLSSSDLNTVF